MTAAAIMALVLIAAAAAVQAVVLLRKSTATGPSGDDRPDPISHWLIGGASALLFAVLIGRSITIGFVAVTGTYESLVFFSAVVCAILFVLRLGARRSPLSPFVTFGATVVSLGLLMISSSPIAPKEVQPLIPALRSIWLALHVTLAFIGESFFVLSLVAAIVSLATKVPERRADMERVMVRSVAIGYPIYTMGALVFGAIWAEAAWGRWWGWDPKETWAFVTWLLYTAFLHTRLVKKLRGNVSAALAITGFVAAVFTYFGVNFLLSGLHSYG